MVKESKAEVGPGRGGELVVVVGLVWVGCEEALAAVGEACLPSRDLLGIGVWDPYFKGFGEDARASGENVFHWVGADGGGQGSTPEAPGGFVRARLHGPVGITRGHRRGPEPGVAINLVAC